MADEAATLYLKWCKLPKDEQIRFLEWARGEINKLDKQLKKEKEQHELSNSETS